MEKRMILVFMCAGLVLVCLPLFAGGQKEGATSATAPVTITEMDYWTSDPGDTAMKNYIAAFQTAHPGVTVQRSSEPFVSYLSKALTMASAHSLPDILELDNPQLQAFASTGTLAALDSFTSIDKSKYYDGPLSTVIYKGRIYGLPVGNNNLAIFYNKKLLQDAGLNPPKTWDDLLADAKALTKGNTYGFAFSARAGEEASWQFEPWLWTNKGDLQTIGSAESIAALKLLVTMVQNGWASKSVTTWGQDEVEQQFENGNAAMQEMGPWMLPQLAKSNIDFGIVPIPVPRSGMAPVPALGGEVFTIPTSTPDKQKNAWTFIAWMQQPDNLIALNKAFAYVPAFIPAAQELVQSNPLLTVFADQMKTGRARTMILGPNYPKVSEIVSSAVQAALVGTATPEAACQQAQQQIDQALKQ
jgi:multiple sugar transport system substrate-binding protein